MNSKGLILVGILCLSQFARAEDNNAKSDLGRISLGFDLGQATQDAQMGLSITSPYVFAQHLGMRYEANIVLHQSINVNDTYQNLALFHYHQLSLIYSIPVWTDLHFNTQIGGFYAFNNSVFASKGALGEFGQFGFEFFAPQFSYFLDLGAMSSGAKADRTIDHAFYLTGALTKIGLRYYF